MNGKKICSLGDGHKLVCWIKRTEWSPTKWNEIKPRRNWTKKVKNKREKSPPCRNNRCFRINVLRRFDTILLEAPWRWPNVFTFTSTQNLPTFPVCFGFIWDLRIIFRGNDFRLSAMFTRFYFTICVYAFISMFVVRPTHARMYVRVHICAYSYTNNTPSYTWM